MNLVTRRLQIRHFRKADITSAYISWLNDPEVTQFSNQRFCTHTFSSCLSYLSSFNRSDNSFLIIERKEDLKPLGTATIYRNLRHGTADIGLMLGEKSAWGLGYGQETWQALMNTLMTEEDIRKITGGTLEPNKAMLRIMRRSGMKLEAVRERHELVRGKAEDVLYFCYFTKETMNGSQYST